MKEQFDAAMRALCEAEEIDQPSQLIDGASLDLHGVEFSFLYDEEVAAEALTLRTVFGTAPLRNETAIYQALLQQNHVGFAGNGPGFCVSPSSGQVLYLLQIPLQQATPDLLAATMLYFTGRVKEWQSTFFLPAQTPAMRRAAFA